MAPRMFVGRQLQHSGRCDEGVCTDAIIAHPLLSASELEALRTGEGEDIETEALSSDSQMAAANIPVCISSFLHSWLLLTSLLPQNGNNNPTLEASSEALDTTTGEEPEGPSAESSPAQQSEEPVPIVKSRPAPAVPTTRRKPRRPVLFPLKMSSQDVFDADAAWYRVRIFF